MSEQTVNDADKKRTYLSIAMDRDMRERTHRLSRKLGYRDSAKMIRNMIQCALNKVEENEKRGVKT